LRFSIPFLSIIRNRGLLIPIIALGVLSALSIVVLYHSSLQSQRGLDRLFEEDLQSFYIAEAGFQYATGRLSSAGRYDQRWYAPKPDFSEGVSYSGGSEKDEGRFEYFLREIPGAAGKVSYVYLLSRGIHFTGREDRFGNREKNVTLLRGKLKFHPTEPSSPSEPQKLFIVSRGALTQADLLEKIQDPRFSSYFYQMDPGGADSLRDLMGALRTTTLGEIDWMAEPRLVSALAMLESLNDSFNQLSQISLKSMSIPNGVSAAVLPATDQPFPQRALDVPAPPHGVTDPIQRIPEGSTDVIGDLKKEMPTLSEDHVDWIIFEEYLEMLEEVDSETLVSTQGGDSSKVSLAHQIRTLRSSQRESQDPMEVLEEFQTKQPKFHFRSGDTLSLQEVEELKEFYRVEKSLERVAEPGGGSSLSPGDEDGESVSDGGEYIDTEVIEDEVEDIEIGLAVEDPYENPLEPENQDMIIRNHTGDLFHDVDPHGPLVGESLEDGFMKIFYTRLRDDAEEFAAYKVATTGRNPTKEEWDVFFASHPIPDRQYVKKIGTVLDNLHTSGQYSYHYGAHVRDHISYGNKAVFTEVEWDPATFKEELQMKLLYYQKPVGTNSEFLSMFQRSTWGDSLGASSMGKDRSSADSSTNYFLVDKKSGERIDLIDYLQGQL